MSRSSGVGLNGSWSRDGADVEGGEHVRMGKGGDRARSVLKALQPRGIRRDRFGEDLDRDVAPETRVARAINLPHAAGADRRDDFIGTEARADRESHRGGSRIQPMTARVATRGGSADSR